MLQHRFAAPHHGSRGRRPYARPSPSALRLCAFACRGTWQPPGADHVLIDDGDVARQVRQIIPGGADTALELVGAPTLPDTLRSVRVQGVVCFSGMLSNQWTVRNFYPMDYLPTGMRLTAYKGGRGRPPAAGPAGLPGRRRRRHRRGPDRPRVPVRPDRGGARRHGAEPGERQARRHDVRCLLLRATSLTCHGGRSK
jgi:hypothetical protein